MLPRLEQRAPGSPLVLVTESPQAPPAGTGQPLQVCACSPSLLDLTPPETASWPRVPGGVLVARDLIDGRLWLCGGFLPCGVCACCQAGAQLSCQAPLRPGVSVPGGFGEQVWLSPSSLAPLDGSWAGDLAALCVLVALAGTTFQAAALAGMMPGDAVEVFGAAGPDALPLQVLRAQGLRPLWQPVAAETAGHSPQTGGPDLSRGPGETGDFSEHLSSRIHLLDLAPSQGSLDRWLPRAGSCLSCTLVSPTLPDLRPSLRALLAGQATVRWVKEIHPHLLLDLAALLHRGEVDAKNRVRLVDPADPAAADLLLDCSMDAEHWPVLIWSSTSGSADNILLDT